MSKKEELYQKTFKILAERFPPSRERLLELVAEIITDDMLIDISWRDDLIEDEDVNLIPLRRIRDTLEVPVWTEREPYDVLAIISACDPCKVPETYWDEGLIGREGHIKRLFACIVLAMAGEIPENLEIMTVDKEDVLPALIHSAISLGGELPSAVASYLTWSISLDWPSWPLKSLGILLDAALGCEGVLIREKEIEEIASYIEEARGEYTFLLSFPTGDRKSWPLCMYICFPSRDYWSELASQVLVRYKGRNTRSLLQMCQRIVDERPPE